LRQFEKPTSQHQAPNRFRSLPFFPTRRAHHGEEEKRLQSHHRHPELRFFNTLCLPACNRCASRLHLHSKPHHHTSTLHRKRLTEDTKNKRFKHKKKPCNTPNYESAPPYNFPKRNSASHIPTASTKQTLETPSSKNKQIQNKLKLSSKSLRKKKKKRRENTTEQASSSSTLHLRDLLRHHKPATKLHQAERKTNTTAKEKKESKRAKEEDGRGAGGHRLS
jgi:hypothetical protein